MQKLQHYLKDARDYDEGIRAADRLRVIYNVNPEKAEDLWKDAFTHEGFDIELFYKLLEEYGLYVYLDNSKKAIYPTFYSDTTMHFALFVWAYGSGIAVPVLKISNPVGGNMLNVLK